MKKNNWEIKFNNANGGISYSLFIGTKEQAQSFALSEYGLLIISITKK